jgi:hypothetical protein
MKVWESGEDFKKFCIKVETPEEAELLWFALRGSNKFGYDYFRDNYSEYNPPPALREKMFVELNKIFRPKIIEEVK